ncbi:MAG TPA: hypothetical protein VMU40_22250 [Steroidobacteraceae bacterium]|nr:hypothetical protein [Steroidobacteraceae bacterium]
MADAGYKSWWVPALGLIFVVLGILLVVFRDHIPGWSRRGRVARTIFPFGFLCFAVAWTLGAFVETYGEYRTASQARAVHRAKVVEGLVTTFVPMPVTGHAMETFCVSGVCFSYSDYDVTVGFNHTSSHGGPIRLGLPVRVTYVGNTIIKLEVGNDR